LKNKASDPRIRISGKNKKSDINVLPRRSLERVESIKKFEEQETEIAP